MVTACPLGEIAVPVWPKFFGEKFAATREPLGARHYYRGMNPTMKTPLKSISLAALCALSVGVATFSGCAATPTRQSTGEYVDDAGITTKVKAAFVKDDLVKALDVKVETFKGVVQLSGFVNTAAEKAQAGMLAGNVAGVTSVKNDIVVK